MATTVTFNGVNYSIPAVNEEDWQSLSNYLIALQNAAVAGGPVRQNIRVSTSSTTAVATTDYVVLINYAGAATVNLPAGVDEQVFVIADASGNASTNNITINRNGFNNILGGASYVLNKDNQSIILGFHAGQGNWYRIAESIPGAIEGPASSVVGGLAAFANTTGDSLQDLGVGSANQVLVTDGTTPSFALIANANVSGSAAIAYSKLALTNSIVNADISSGAAIAYSKLTLTGSIVNADINASAAIAYSKLNLSGSIVNSDVNASAAIDYSKLNLSGSIVNADVNASAAIAYSKLNLTGSIVNADVNASAAIAYSKLTLTGSIVNADINASAAIARSKIASGSASHVVVNDGAGALSSVATLPVSQGGTGLNTLGSALQVLRVDSLGTSLEFATLAAGSGDVIGPASSVTNGIVQFASTTGKALKDLGVGSANQVLLTNGTAPSFGQITNAYIDATAAIDFSKMAALTASRALETDGSGFIVASAVTSTELGYVSGVTSAIQTQIDGKLSLTGGTLTGALTITPTTNQLVLGTTNTTTISATAPAASRVYTIPDAGGAADFVLTAGAQTIGGAKTFSSNITAAINSQFPQLAVRSTSVASTLNSFIWGNNTNSNAFAIVHREATTATHFVSTPSDLTNGTTVANEAALTILDSGNVGIGTASPNAKLQLDGGSQTGGVVTSTTPTLILSGTNDASSIYGKIRWDFTGDGITPTSEGFANWGLTSGGLRYLAWSYDGTAVMSVTNAGAVTLGPSSGGGSHTIQAGAGAVVRVLTIDNTTSSATLSAIAFETEGTQRGFVAFTNTNLLQFLNNGASVVSSMTSAGAWTLGPSGGTALHALNTAALTTSTAAGVSYLRITINGATRRIPTYNDA